MLGRRRHSRFLLAEPVDGNLRVREEVVIERWEEREVVVLSPEPLKRDELVALEIPGDSRRRVSVRVSESRPAIAGDGAIRHRLVLSIHSDGGGVAPSGGHEA
jgi:hypothetical protein